MKTIKKIYSCYRNMKIRAKLLWIYALMLIVTILLLNIVLRATLEKRLYAHEESVLTNELAKAATQMAGQISDIIDFSDVIYNNDELLEACNVGYGQHYLNMYFAYSNVIQPQLYIYKFLRPDITDICIYSDCGLVPYKGLVKNLADLQETPLFEQAAHVHNPQWGIINTENEPKVVSLRKLPQNSIYPYNNYLYLEMNYDDFFSCIKNIGNDTFGVVVMDNDNQVLFNYVSNNSSDIASYIDTITINSDTSSLKFREAFLSLETEISPVGWKVYYLSPANNIRHTVSQVLFTTFIMITLCFTLLFFLTFFMVNSMLSPLQKLTKIIGEISLEDMEQHELLPLPDRHDEIGTLIKSFRSMLKHIGSLIDEAYVQKLKTKEYQLKSLRAQINPHFLYNTLSMINAKAVISEQNEISQTVKQLTIFYRTSLNKGEAITTIENELENIKAYISLQLMLTGNAFQVEYHLDEELLDVEIPSLILQPLVENAIEHGLKNSRRFPKKLTVTLSMQGNICLIAINDNGCGISKNRYENLFSLDTGHIGIKNVNERLKLSYGDAFGLQIESSEEKGTVVTVRIPM